MLIDRTFISTATLETHLNKMEHFMRIYDDHDSVNRSHFFRNLPVALFTHDEWLRSNNCTITLYFRFHCYKTTEVV